MVIIRYYISSICKQKKFLKLVNLYFVLFFFCSPIDLIGNEFRLDKSKFSFNITYQLSNYNGYEVSCFGGSDGAIDLTVNGGLAPYSFNWSNGSTNEDLANLNAGIYKVFILDAALNSDSAEIIITEPPQLIIFDDSIINPLCYGLNSGAIYLTVAGGVGPYLYNWSGGQTTDDIANLGAFDYTISVTDNNGCQASNQYTIIQPSLLNLKVDSINNQACGIINSADIFISVSGGSAPINYSWSDGSTDNDRIGIPPGTYMVTATDQNGCTDTASATVINIPPAIIITDSLKNVSCFGNNDGAIFLSVDNGSPPVNYLWSNGATVDDISNLNTGLYTIAITDSMNCMTSQSFAITEPAQLFIVVDSIVNVLCNGNNSGAIYTSIVGGTSPFIFSWSNGATIEDISGLTPTTYSLTVTDANGCLAYMTKVISQPAALFTSISTFTNPACNGFTNGNISLSVSGGFAPYQYNWSNGATTQNLSGLSAGIFTVTVSDVNGCTSTVSQTLTEPPIILIVVDSFTNVSCTVPSNGTINITTSGGVPPYSYFWSNGSTNQNLTGVAAGTYTVTVTDSIGCAKSISHTLTLATTLDVVLGNFTNISCNGDTTGTISVIASGGISPYVFLWNTSSTNQNLSNIGAGTYTVMVTDFQGCTKTLSQALTEPLVLDILFDSIIHVSCNGGSTGSLSITPNGGTSPYSYSWSNSSTSQNQTGLTAGTYTVTVTDANGCTAAVSQTITEPAALSVSVSSFTNIGCSGGATGTIGISVTGGTSPYSYLWSNGSTLQNQASLTAGTYTVTVTDTNGCTATVSQTITEPTALNVSISSFTNIGCNGGATGAISISATGGTSPYSYLWSNGSTLQNQASLTAGTYTVTVTDTNGCTATVSQTITEPTALNVSISSFTNIGCNGGATGAISISATGGTSPYSYLWSNGSTIQNQASLTAGTYTVTVTDANGCTATVSQTITEPTALSVSVSSFTNIGCNGGATGAISISVTGGTSPYSYLWSIGSTIQNQTGLTAGTYTVTVTDANGCTATVSQTITEPTALSVSVSSFTNIGCNGGATGTIGISVTGGTSPYSYLWSNGSTLQNQTGLTAGTYTVTVTDANGCTATVSQTITEPTALNVSVSSFTNIGCNGGATGAISISATGGTSPYSYLWSNSSTLQNQASLTAGTYTVTVTDTNGCTATVSQTITEPTALNVSISSFTNIGCNGGATGAISISVTGGTSPFSYLWSNGSTIQNQTGLTAGTYTVTVTDTNGCTATVSQTITEPTALNVSISSFTNIGCNGGATGAISISATGGTSPYSYLWSNSSTLQNQTGLTTGTYTVTVTDTNGCTATVSQTITEPTALSVSVSSFTNIGCNGGATGAISISVTGGISSYSYLWSNGSTIQNQTGLTSGTYTVTVTDTNGCTATVSQTITEPTALSVSVSSFTNIGCNGGATGAISISVAGGTSPFSYLWSNGSTIQNQTGLTSGTYTVTVTDTNGCTATVSQTITEPTALNVSVSSFTNIGCNGGATGAISISVTGGTSPYSYLWSNGSTIQNQTGLTAGTYTVTVTDANGCIATVSQTITEPTALNVSISSFTNIGCNGGATGAISISVTGGTSPYSYLWSNGSTIQNQAGLTAGTYTVTVTDANGCTATVSQTITEPTALSVSVSSFTNIGCNGGATGAISISATGGTSPYSYLWSNGSTIQNQTGLTAGTYTVTVTDANGCIATVSQTITEPTALSVAVSSFTNIGCNGGATGAISVSVTGGTSPYSYLWSNGSTIQNQTGLTAGTYTVTVTDTNGCTITGSQTLTGASGLVVSVSSFANVSCNGGATGAISIAAIGGTTPYSFLWSNGSTVKDQTSLVAGTYTVTVTDVNGCTVTTSQVIQSASGLVINIDSITNPSCYGASNGAIYISVLGGTLPYDFSWSNASTAEDIINLNQGFYTVSVTDLNGCSATLQQSISQPDSIVILVDTLINSPCFQVDSGSIQITALGGTPPYSYLWSNGETTQDIFNLLSGNYSVTVTDSLGCFVTASYVITQPPDLVGVITSVSNVACNGQSTGSIIVFVGGGAGGYNYSWSNGSTTQNLTSLAAGTYSLSIKDVNNCFVTIDTTVTEPLFLQIDLISKNDVTCYGGSNGSITIQVSGGVPPYSYLWNNGNTTVSMTGLIVGLYTLLVTDANGCTKTYNESILQNDSLSITFNTASPTCNQGNGSIGVIVSGGTAPYTYIWNTGGTNDTVLNVSAGLFTVTVSDFDGCSTTATVNLNNLNGPTVEVDSIHQPLCNGPNVGSIFINASGGTAPYTYIWSDGSSNEDLINVPIGIYSLTVTDATGCISIITDTIQVVDSITVQFTVTNAQCNLQNGAVTTSVNGGAGPYFYLWSNGDTNSQLSNVIAGTYTVTITDANSCIAIDSIQIGNAGNFTVQLNVIQNALCFGANTGAISCNPIGGVAPYSFLWSNAITNQNVVSLLAGTYTVTVTDAQGCTSSASETITQPSEIELITSTVNSLCGQANGSAGVSVTGGVGPYQYNWSNGSTLNATGSAGAGTYTVTVTDAINCTVSATAIISNTNGPVALVTGFTNNACHNDSSGSIVISVSGGAPPYSVLWSNGTTMLSNNFIPSGTYTATVTDSNNCTSVVVQTIIQPDSINIATIVTPAICTNDNGSITATASGGSGALLYFWSTGATVQTVSGLSSGIYTVTITDQNSCTKTASIVVNYFAPPNVSISSFSNISCYGFDDGSISINVTSGTPPFTYLWSNGSSVSNQTNLAPGNYSVIVTDSLGCKDTATQFITEPDSLYLTLSGTNLTCGNQNGVVGVMANGGTPTYTYLWSNNNTNANQVGLAAGTYTVTVTDDNGCTRTGTQTIVALSTPLLAVQSQVNVSCNGGSNGSINMTVTGGQLPYTYLWSTGVTTNSLSGLIAGNYTVTVTDANGCKDSLTVNLSQPVVLAANLIKSNAICGSNNGQVSANVIGGTSPYSFLWSNAATTATINSLAAGTYTVTVTDDKGCTVAASVSIVQINAPVISVQNIGSPSCNGGSNGFINLNASGAGILGFLWSNAATTQNLSSIPAGTYTVTVTDTNGCTSTLSQVIIEPAPIDIVMAKVDVTCNAPNGVAIASASGGTGNLTYLWNNGNSTNTITGLLPGVYTVTVTDNNLCSSSVTVSIISLATPVITFDSVKHVSCNGGSDGYASVFVTGGASPYSFLWSNGSTTNSASGLTAALVLVTVTDASNCSVFEDTLIIQPVQLNLALSSTPVSCISIDGTATVVVSGGTLPYSYLWSNSSTNASLSGQNVGTYTVTVTDGNGCSITDTVTINKAPSPVIAFNSVTGIGCTGNAIGAIDMGVTGGLSFTYLWSNSATTQDIGNLFPGVYTITVTNNYGCTAVDTVVVPGYYPIAISSTVVNATCENPNGSISILPGGGSGIYFYLWNSGATTSSITGLAAGVYTVTVTDNQLCTTTSTFSIVNLASPGIVIDSIVEPLCAGNANAAIYLTASGNGILAYNWSSGSTLDDLIGVQAGTYTISVIDSNNCQTDSTIIISPTLAMQVLFNVVPANCGLLNGAIIATIVNGSQPYNYLWNDGSTNGAIDTLGAGLYTLTVTDNNGCIISDTVSVPTINKVLFTIDSIVKPRCNGGNDGGVYLNVQSASLFSYVWTGGATTEDLTGAVAGSYTLSITGPNGCSFDTTFIVSQPTALGVSFQSVASACSSATGIASINVVGGTPSYTYSWSNGATSNANLNIGAGTYTCTVTDINGCIITDSVVIGLLSNIQLVTDSVINEKCYGQANGGIFITPSNGIPIYNYLWSNGATGQNVTGLPAGSYSVVVTDSAGCQDSASFIIAQPDSISISLQSVAPDCNTANGSITALPAGGTPSYSYLWDNASTDATLSNLAQGTYTVTVTDNNGCVTTISQNLFAVGAPVIAIDSIVHVVCGGSNSGAIYITATGNQPFSYNWSNGATVDDFMGIAGGIYTVTVTDAAGCTSLVQVNVNENPEILLTPGSLSAACGTSNGVAFVSAAGGVTPYTYFWPFDNSTNDTLSSLLPGSYDVIVTDSLGCTKQVTVNVSNANAPVLNIDTVVHVNCAGGSNGAIFVSTNGGTSPYTYLWNNGNTNEDLLNVISGIYTLTIVDALGCVMIISDTITEPDSLQLAFTTTSAGCALPTGSATVIVTGGVPNYSYQWNVFSVTQSINGVPPGVYTVTVTDDNQCTASASVAITTTPAPVITNSNVVDLSCFNSADGSIDITVSSGQQPYTFLWSNGATTEDLTAIAAGTYTVTVTDANNCTVVQQFSVTEPTEIQFNVLVQNAPCNTANGSAAVTNLFGGQGPYSFLWSTSLNDTNDTLTGLSAGSYIVTVTDAKNCTKTAIVNVSNTSGPIIQQDSIGMVSCYGGANGYIAVSVSGISPPFTALWSNGNTNLIINGLTAGSYVLEVTDNVGCKTVQTFIIAEPNALVINSQVAINNPPLYNISCNGASDGSISVTTSGGAFPYSYLWSIGSTSSSISGLAAGTYTVIVTDANNCTASTVFLLSEPPTLNSDAGSNIEICGVDTVVLNAVNPTYGYGFWAILSGGGNFGNISSNTSTVYNMPPGVSTFMWIVADSSSCKDTSLVLVNVLDGVTALAGTDREICENEVLLNATAPQFGLGAWMVASGTALIFDSTKATTQAFQLNQGNNIFQWIVVNGACVDTDEVNIFVKDSLDCLSPLEFPTGFSPNGDNFNEYYVIRGILEYPDNVLIVYNRWGNIVYEKKSYANEWRGTNIDGDILPEGTYYVTVRVAGFKKYFTNFVDIRR